MKLVHIFILSVFVLFFQNCEGGFESSVYSSESPFIGLAKITDTDSDGIEDEDELSLNLDPYLRDDVLIIANMNSKDSPRLAQYYAERRKVSLKNIVKLHSDISYFATLEVYQDLRDQILKHMYEKAIPQGSKPELCAGDRPYYCEKLVKHIRENTWVRYIVMTRGLAFRFTNTITKSSVQPGSVDEYLKNQLANYYEGESSFNGSDRLKRYKLERSLSPVKPSLDKEYIIARVEAMDLESSKALVDRAIKAEEEGLYGNLFITGDQGKFSGGQLSLINELMDKQILAESTNAYALSHWGEDREECRTYLSKSASTPEGKAPVHCKVQMTSANGVGPSGAASRNPRPVNAQMYRGYLDGQIASSGRFENVLNWTKNSTCEIKLCKDHHSLAEQDKCRALSTDVYKELDTRCVGVANGFFGFNYQSYPVSYMNIYATGWGQTTGDTNKVAHHEVVDNDGSDDNFSLWFKKSDQIENPVCHSDNAYAANPNASCKNSHRVFTEVTYDNDDFVYDASMDLEYQLSIDVKQLNLEKEIPLYVNFIYYKSNGNSGRKSSVSYKLGDIGKGTLNWATFSQLVSNPEFYAKTYCKDLYPAQTKCSLQDVIDRDSASFPDKTMNIKRIGFRFTTPNFTGDIGIDNLQIQFNGLKLKLENPSFNEGHKNVSYGDHASVFLSRLGGTAFWGSLSHYKSGGHSFKEFNEKYQLFKSGLNLGESVWAMQTRHSGVVYGDPLYSPMAVHIQPPQDPKGRIFGKYPIYASVLNGKGSHVITTYSLEYCSGSKIGPCNQANAWKNLNISGVAKGRRLFLGSVDTADIDLGAGIVRLSVTSKNTKSNRTQTIRDYVLVENWGHCKPAEGSSAADALDTDGDHLVNYCDTDDDNDNIPDSMDAMPLDKNEFMDTDQDGVGDNADLDDDNDLIPDAVEAQIGTDSKVYDTPTADSDGDGIGNALEVQAGSDPGDKTSVPQFKTLYFNSLTDLAVDQQEGSLEKPYSKSDQISASFSPGDTVYVLGGKFDLKDFEVSFINIRCAPSGVERISVEGTTNFSAYLSVRSCQGLNYLKLSQYDHIDIDQVSTDRFTASFANHVKIANVQSEYLYLRETSQVEIIKALLNGKTPYASGLNLVHSVDVLVRNTLIYSDLSLNNKLVSFLHAEQVHFDQVTLVDTSPDLGEKILGMRSIFDGSRIKNFQVSNSIIYNQHMLTISDKLYENTTFKNVLVYKNQAEAKMLESLSNPLADVLFEQYKAYAIEAQYYADPIFLDKDGMNFQLHPTSPALNTSFPGGELGVYGGE